ncbi:MAG: hypothetical protein U0599_13235 [Vicinamibacteria bacterium]
MKIRSLIGAALVLVSAAVVASAQAPPRRPPLRPRPPSRRRW